MASHIDYLYPTPQSQEEYSSRLPFLALPGSLALGLFSTGLLTQDGAGSATNYRLTTQSSLGDVLPLFPTSMTNTGDLSANTGDLSANTGDLFTVAGHLSINTEELPAHLKALIHQLSPKARRERLWPVIVWLCALKPFKAEQLAHVLGGRQVTSLKSNHINKLRDEEALLAYRYPETENHPEQAYVATKKGLNWLRKQGIKVDD